MNDIFIYTFGQLDTFKTVLMAISAMFDPSNSEFFVSGDGIGAGAGALLAALLATLGVVSNYFQKGQVGTSPAGPLVGLIVYASLCVPKVENVWLSDLYTGRVELVQNVPLGIATLGFGMSTISKNMIDIFEQEYSQPGVIGGDDYLSSMTNGNGFLSPLKLMMSLRENMLKPAPYHLIHNVAAYTKYCLHKKKEIGSSPYFNVATLRTSSDPLSYFLDPNLFVNTFTERMNPTTGEAGVSDCATLHGTLSSAGVGGLKYYLSNPSTFGTYAYGTLMVSNEAQSDLCRGELASGGTCDTKGSAITKSDSLLSAVLGSMNTNQRYMEVRLLQDITELTGTVGDMSSQTVENIAVTMTENVELSRMQETIEGETFLHFMIPAMNAMTYLFYALFPLAMIIMVARGSGALMYLGGYMLFGLWVYSWIPVATIINFSTIASVMDAFAVMSSQIPLTIDTNNFYIQQAMDAVAVGSNLLAATPVITLAIVSGSMFALTSVASSSANPSGAASALASKNTPSYHNSPSLVEAKSSYIATDSANGYAGGGSAHVSKLVGNRSFAASETVESSLSSAKRMVTQASSNLSAAVGSVYGTDHSVAKGVTSQNATTLATRQTASVKEAYQAALGEMGVDTTNASLSQMSAWGGLLGTGKGGVGVGGHVQENSSGVRSQSTADEFNQRFAAALEKNGALDLITQASSGEQASNIDAKSAKKLTTAGNQYSEATSLATQKEEEAKASRSAKQSQTLTGTEVYNHLSRQTGGASNYYQGNKDTLAAIVGGSAEEHKLGEDAEKFKAQLSTETDRVNYSELGGETTGLAAFESGMIAVSNLRRDAEDAGSVKEAAMWADVASDLSMGALKQSYAGHQFSADKKATQPIAKDIANATVESDASKGIKGAQQAIKTGFQTNASADTFTPAEKSTFTDLGKQMDAQANNWNVGDRAQNHFSNDYFRDTALNKAAIAQGMLTEEDISNGKTFDNLGEVQKRRLMAGQESDALNEFAMGTGQQINGEGKLGPKDTAKYFQQLSNMAGLFEKYQDKIGDNKSPHHGKGVVGQQELSGLTRQAREIIDQVPKMTEVARSEGEINAQLGDTQRQALQGAVDVTDTGLTGIATGRTGGIDPEKMGPAYEFAQEASQKIKSAEMTQGQANDWFLGKMEDLLSDNGQGNMFSDHPDNLIMDNPQKDMNSFLPTVESFLDENRSPEMALAGALKQSGYNMDGVVEKGTIDAFALGTATGMLNTGKSGLLDFVKNPELDTGDVKTNKNALGLDDAQKASKGFVGDALDVSKSFGKGSLPGLIAGFAMAGVEYYDENKSLKERQQSEPVAMLQDKIVSTLNSMPPERQQQARAEFMDAMIDRGFTNDSIGNYAKAEFKASLISESETGHYTNDQMLKLMDKANAPDNSKEGGGKRVMNFDDLYDTFNAVKSAPNI